MDVTPIAYNVQQAAEACGVSPDTIRRAIRANDLPVKYPSARPVIRREDLVAWMDSRPDQWGAA
jgi:excisionase family DNA binding protein